METWIIAIGAVIICGAMLAACLSVVHSDKKAAELTEGQLQRLQTLETEREELLRQSDLYHKDNKAMLRDLRMFEAQLKELNAELDHTRAQADEQAERLEEHAQATADAGRERQTLIMRLEIADKECRTLREQMRAQEKLYQSIIDDKEQQLQKYEMKQQRRARKTATQDGQIGFEEILGGDRT